MNTTAIAIRLIIAAPAVAIAASVAGCGAADPHSEADISEVIQGAGQGMVRFVPNDLDPRGHHVVRESYSGDPAPNQYGPVVDDYLSPLTGR